MHGKTINSSLQSKVIFKKSWGYWAGKESDETYNIPLQSSGASCSKSGTNRYPLDKCWLNN